MRWECSIFEWRGGQTRADGWPLGNGQLQLTLAHDWVGSTGAQVNPPAREQTKSWAETQLELSLLKKADVQPVTEQLITLLLTNCFSCFIRLFFSNKDSLMGPENFNFQIFKVFCFLVFYDSTYNLFKNVCSEYLMWCRTQEAKKSS